MGTFWYLSRVSFDSSSISISIIIACSKLHSSHLTSISLRRQTCEFPLSSTKMLVQPSFFPFSSRSLLTSSRYAAQQISISSLFLVMVVSSSHTVSTLNSLVRRRPLASYQHSTAAHVVCDPSLIIRETACSQY